MRFAAFLLLPAIASFAAPPTMPDDEKPALPTASADHISWQGAFGTSGRLGTREWLGVMRALPSVISLDVTGSKPADAAHKTVAGKFSGEQRLYDFDGNVTAKQAPEPRVARPRTFKYGTNPKSDAPLEAEPPAAARRVRGAVAPTPFLSARKTLMLVAAKNVTAVWPLGRVSFNQPEKVKLLTEKNGAYFKDAIYAAVRMAYTGDLADKPERVWWELGDAIDTPAGFSVREPGGSPPNPDAYVQLYLAPAVEAIRSASQEMFGDERRIPIVLGGVADSSQPAARDFIAALLETEIDGTHAPSLKGRRAFELIDAINIPGSAADHDFLAALHERWIASGKVKGLWSTGELGLRGLGNMAVAVTSLRWLDFWARRDWTSARARLIFREDTASHPGTTTEGDAMQRHLGDLLQNYPLTALDSARDVRVVSAGAWEWHGVRADLAGGDRHYILIFVPGFTTQSALDTVKLLIPKDTRGAVVSAGAHIIPRDKPMKVIDTTSSEDADGLVIDLRKFEAHTDETILVEVVLAAKSP